MKTRLECSKEVDEALDTLTNVIIAAQITQDKMLNMLYAAALQVVVAAGEAARKTLEGKSDASSSTDSTSQQ